MYTPYCFWFSFGGVEFLLIVVFIKHSPLEMSPLMDKGLLCEKKSQTAEDKKCGKITSH